MTHDGGRMRKSKTVSASQLGSACVCEQQAMFDSKRGLRRSSAHMKRIEGGIDAHERLHAAARVAYADVETSLPDRRCFVATHMFGTDAAETNALRDWRDTTLMKTTSGRAVVDLYYRLSPIVVKAMDGSELLKVAMKWGIRKLIGSIVKGERLR